jgi:hypothetical protein
VTISPILEGTVEPGVDTCTAYWGYNNPNAYPVTLAAGTSDNQFIPGGDLGQPSDFSPGRQVAVFATTWSGGGNLVWSLDGRTSTAGWCNPPTATPTATATPTPTPTGTATPLTFPLPSGGEVACGESHQIDLGFDTFIRYIIYYEFLAVPDLSACGGNSGDSGFCMDWVFLDLEHSGGARWNSVFNWGDTEAGNNGSLGDIAPEPDNYPVVGYAGIVIPVNGTYRYLYIGTNDCPGNGGEGDPAQVFSIEVYP